MEFDIGRTIDEVIPVDDDTLDGGEESGVQSPDEAIGLVRLNDAVKEALELAVGGGLANIGTWVRIENLH